ncbi:hypothetical protein GCM10010470_64180 [Saccharopolyspora taberi]|uniref:Uncharacterized protein n=1 Tax=Saccharopolyspora taberi TaxID=60895 RepID=A0ABN3VQE7_9PSEU
MTASPLISSARSRGAAEAGATVSARAVQAARNPVTARPDVMVRKLIISPVSGEYVPISLETFTGRSQDFTRKG